MKQKWENPDLLEIGIERTKEDAGTFDDPHDGSDVPHIHKCMTCNVVFPNWGDLKVHGIQNPNCNVQVVPVS